MILIFGDKQYTKKMGFAAEHCPRCDTTRVFRINRIGLTAHVFWLPMGTGHLLGYTAVCQHCGVEFDAEPTNYTSLVKKNKAALTDMVEATNPRLNPNNRSDSSAFQRFAVLREPFLRVNKTLHVRYTGNTKLDLRSGLVFFLAFALPAALTMPDYEFLSPENEQRLGSLAGFIFIFGLIAGFVVLYREPRRYFQRNIEPELVQSLRGMNPQLSELQDCIARMKKYEYKIGNFVKAEDLLEKISMPV